jgi:hypothetical protein
VPQIDINEFIDHSLLARIQAKLTAADQRRTKTTEDLLAAGEALKNCKFASRIAIDRQDNDAAMQAEADFDKADRALRVAEKMSVAAEREWNRVSQWALKATDAAHARLYKQGMNWRLEAAQKMQLARTAIIEAQAEFAAAVRLCAQAGANGHVHLSEAHNQQNLIFDGVSLEIWLNEAKTNSLPAMERARWRNFDPIVTAESIIREEPSMEKSISRPEFDALDPGERRKFFKDGGTVVDPSPAPGKIADPEVITRAEFQAMTPREQFNAVREGKKIVDGHRAAQAGG